MPEKSQEQHESPPQKTRSMGKIVGISIAWGLGVFFTIALAMIVAIYMSDQPEVAWLLYFVPVAAVIGFVVASWLAGVLQFKHALRLRGGELAQYIVTFAVWTFVLFLIVRALILYG